MMLCHAKTFNRVSKASSGVFNQSERELLYMQQRLTAVIVMTGAWSIFTLIEDYEICPTILRLSLKWPIEHLNVFF